MESSTAVFAGTVAAFIFLKFIQGLRMRKIIPQWLSRGAIVIDVRTPAEFAAAANPQSINIPLDQLEGKASTLPTGKPLIVCCASGMRSAAAKAILKSKGFNEVLNAGTWTRTLVMMLLTLFSLPHSFAEEWIKRGEEAGVVVYQRDLPGSDVVAFRGEAVIEASMPRIVGVLENVERGKEWMADIAESYNIEKHTETDRWEYNRTKTPWPLQDRDFVIHTQTRFTKDPEPRLIIEMTSGENLKKPVIPGVVRGELLDSRFILKRISAKKTHLTCEILADPKGVIPKWVVNLFQSHWPVATIKGLRKQLQKPDIVENQNLAQLLEKP